MKISKETSKALAIALNKAIKGEGIVFSPRLETYLIVIVGGEGFIDPYSTRIYSKEEVGELE